jgi:hypothetical protein
VRLSAKQLSYRQRINIMTGMLSTYKALQNCLSLFESLPKTDRSYFLAKAMEVQGEADAIAQVSMPPAKVRAPLQLPVHVDESQYVSAAKVMVSLMRTYNQKTGKGVSARELWAIYNKMPNRNRAHVITRSTFVQYLSKHMGTLWVVTGRVASGGRPFNLLKAV